MKVWNVAVVGCGDISQIYFDNMIHRFENLHVTACGSRFGKSAVQKADIYGIKAQKFDEILADPEIEVIVNLTPPAEHYAIIKASLEHGKHVYTEKVMTHTYDKAKELIGLARDRNLMLGSAPDTCMGAGVQTALRAVADGLIGDITGCAAVLNRNNGALYDRLPFLTQPGAGIGFDVGIYYLSALLTILGPVVEVSGKIHTREPFRTNRLRGSEHYGERYEIKGENIMCGHMEFKSGALGTVLFNGNCIFPERPYLVIHGTEGILNLPDPNTFGGQVLLQKGLTDKEEELDPVNSYFDNSRGLGVSELMRAYEEGRTTDRSINIAAHAVEILEGFVLSSRTRTFIKPESSF